MYIMELRDSCKKKRGVSQIAALRRVCRGSGIAAQQKKHIILDNFDVNA